MDKILVIMPCYNVENTIIEALDSVYNQTYKDYILVCCDDKSTDNTYIILNNNKEKYGYLLFQNETNMGTGNAVNKIIKIMCDEWEFEFITWISGDNILNDTFLEKHIEKIKEGFAITYSGWMTFGDMNIAKQLPHQNLVGLKNYTQLGPSFLFRKKLWDVAGPFHELPGEDYYFAVSCALNDAKFGFVNDILVRYRKHNNSVGGRLERNIINKKCSLEAKQNAEGINIMNGTKTYE